MFEPMKTGISLPPAGVPFGKYRLDYRIGVGGMGEVYKGHLVGLGGFDKVVVIKRILRAHLAEPEFMRMFLDEARLVAHLSHPNIAQVFEIDEYQGQPYLAMEYVAGPTFHGMIQEAHRRGDVRMGCVAKILSKVCDGLHHAHNARDGQGQALGIVHRDVSPPNILVSVEGVPKLVDFGVAMARGRMSTSSPGLVKGKLRYVAPEQLRGEPLDGRADVFSTGVCLYEATTGRRPFDGRTEAEVMHNILEGRFIKPSKIVAEYPPELEAVVNWSLKGDPAARCPSAKAMQEALESFVTDGEYRAKTQDIAEWIDVLFPETAGRPEQRYVAGRTHEPSPSPRSAGPVSVPPLPAETAESTAPMAASPAPIAWDAEPVMPAAKLDPLAGLPGPPLPDELEDVSMPGAPPAAAEPAGAAPSSVVDDDIVLIREATPAAGTPRPEVPAPAPAVPSPSGWRLLLVVGLSACVVIALWVAGTSAMLWASYRRHGGSASGDVQKLAHDAPPPPRPAPAAPVAVAPVAVAAAPAPSEPAPPAPAAAPEPPPAQAAPPPAPEPTPPAAEAPADDAEPPAEAKPAPRHRPEPPPRAEKHAAAHRPAAEARPADAEPDKAPDNPVEKAAPAPDPAAEERPVTAAPSEGVVQDPAMARNTLHLAELLFQNGALPKALRTARRAAGQDPSFAAAHALVGSILVAEGNCDAARQAFQTALALDPADKTAREGMAACKGR